MRKSYHAAAFGGVLALLFVGCTANVSDKAAIDTETLRPEIQAKEDAYAAAEKAKDAAGVAAYYAQDAVSYSRNEAPLSGQAAIKESIAKRIASDTTGNHSVYKVVDLFAEGDLLVEIGSWTQINPAGAEVDKGHYMSVFQKQNGKYLCIRDMNVSSSPAK